MQGDEGSGVSECIVLRCYIWTRYVRTCTSVVYWIAGHTAQCTVSTSSLRLDTEACVLSVVNRGKAGESVPAIRHTRTVRTQHPVSPYSRCPGGELTATHCPETPQVSNAQCNPASGSSAAFPPSCAFKFILPRRTVRSQIADPHTPHYRPPIPPQHTRNTTLYYVLYIHHVTPVSTRAIFPTNNQKPQLMSSPSHPRKPDCTLACVTLACDILRVRASRPITRAHALTHPQHASSCSNRYHTPSSSPSTCPSSAQR